MNLLRPPPANLSGRHANRGSVFITATLRADRLARMASPVIASGVLGSRQKNCNSCVQTKRRCDRRTPVCSRCAEKNTTCVYGKARAPNRNEQHDIRPSSQAGVLPFNSPDVSLFDFVSPFEAGCFDSLHMNSVPVPPGSAPQSVPTAFVGEDISMDSFIEFVGNENPPSPDRCLVPADQNLAIDRPGTPADEEITNSYQKMASFCVSPGQIRFIERKWLYCSGKLNSVRMTFNLGIYTTPKRLCTTQ